MEIGQYFGSGMSGLVVSLLMVAAFAGGLYVKKAQFAFSRQSTAARRRTTPVRRRP